MPDRLSYPHLATRLFDTPLLIAQSKLDVILGVLGERMGFEPPAEVQAAAHHRGEEMSASLRAAGLARADAGYWKADGVAVVPIIGSTVQRGGYIGYSGMTSYDAIERMVMAAEEDDEVEEIIEEIDSPGGEASGAFDLADRLYQLRGEKRITAVASELALSAGYLLASAADEVVVARSGYLGSIGVVTAHLDVSGEMEKRGRAVTFVHAGAHKIDGNPYAPLPDDVRASMQADVDRLYGLFVDAVATHRGLDPQTIRSTEAACYMGALGVDRGLADRVGSFAETFSAVRSRTRPPGVYWSLSNPHQERSMSDPKKPADAGNTEALAAQARAEGAREGAAAERQRIQGILTHAEAEGRAEMAQHLAFATDMAADAATALLSKSPKAAKADGGLAAAMQQVGTPAVGAEASAGDGPKAEAAIDTNAIYNRRAQSFRAVTH